MKNFLCASTIAIGLAITASTVDAQSKVRVQFARGKTSSTVTGTIHGYAYKDYVVGASSGQTIDVRLDKNTKCVFAIFKPGGDNLDNSAEQNEFAGQLPVSGDFVVRVMMMRNDARHKGSVSNYRLTISIH